MKDITSDVFTCYRHNGKFYTISNRRGLRLNDMFLDGRDYGVKIIESIDDLSEMSFINPELYVILEEFTVQN